MHNSRLARRSIKARAQFCCEYCLSQEAYSPDPFSVDHIVPIAAGGQDLANNLALACQGCNNYKHVKTYALDPLTLKEVALFHPRRDDWHEHFTWTDDFAELIGLTPSSRATIAELRLNRENVVNLRRALAEIGKHPPTHRLPSR
jgi:HNH endonuclease